MNGWLWFVLGAFTAGGFVGCALLALLSPRIYQRGVLDGQAQAERAHGWHPSPVDRVCRGADRWALVDRNLGGPVRPSSPFR